MVHEVAAIFENGILRPLGPVFLNEGEEVLLTISDELAVDGRTQGEGNQTDLMRFCEALDAPMKINPKLRKLFAEPSVFDAVTDPKKNAPQGKQNG